MSLILCSGYCEHNKFMGECWECVANDEEESVSDLEQAIDRIEIDFRVLGEEPDKYTALVLDAARRFASLTSPETIEKHRDDIDPYVAEALYHETIALNVDARGGTATGSEWPDFDELPDIAREHWLSMAVAARLSFLAVLRSVEEGET